MYLGQTRSGKKEVLQVCTFPPLKFKYIIPYYINLYLLKNEIKDN